MVRRVNFLLSLSLVRRRVTKQNLHAMFFKQVTALLQCKLFMKGQQPDVEIMRAFGMHSMVGYSMTSI